MLVLYPLLPDGLVRADDFRTTEPAHNRVMIEWSDGEDGSREMIELSDDWRARGAVFVLIDMPLPEALDEEDEDRDEWHAELARRVRDAAQSAFTSAKTPRTLRLVP